MNFGAILSAVGLAAVKAEAQATARRFGKQAAIAGATGILILAAICLAIAALTVWLAGEVGTIWALLIVAGGLLVIAAIVQIVARLSARQPAYRRPYVAQPPPFVGATAPLPDSEPAAPPTGSVVGSAAIVALVGFVLARQFMRK